MSHFSGNRKSIVIAAIAAIVVTFYLTPLDNLLPASLRAGTVETIEKVDAQTGPGYGALSRAIERLTQVSERFGEDTPQRNAIEQVLQLLRGFRGF